MTNRTNFLKPAPAPAKTTTISTVSWEKAKETTREENRRWKRLGFGI